MGTAISNVHKEIYKAAKHCLTDRVMAVRCAAAKVTIVTPDVLISWSMMSTLIMHFSAVSTRNVKSCSLPLSYGIGEPRHIVLSSI